MRTGGQEARQCHTNVKTAVRKSNWRLVRYATLLLVVCVGIVPASAQVLVTGEPGGAKAQAVVVTANLISVKDFGTLKNFWAEYGYGLTNRVDVFAAYGVISVFGETQHYISGGTNVGLLQRRRHGLDVSFFSNVSVAVTRRDEAATLLGTFAVIASRPVTIGSLSVTPYGGFEALVPIGQRARGVFTPVETLHAGVIGVAIPLDKTWAAFVEYDPGPRLRSGGAGIAVTIPRE